MRTMKPKMMSRMKKWLTQKMIVVGWVVVLWKMIDDCDYYDNVNDCADVDVLGNNDCQHYCCTVVVDGVVVDVGDGVMVVKILMVAVGQVKIEGTRGVTIVGITAGNQSLFT